MPTMPTRSDGPTLAALTALYVVTPAHESGAASSGSMPSGTSPTKSAFAIEYSR